MKRLLIRISLCLSLYTLYCILHTPTALAVVDPLAVPNNKFGIHLIQATHEESSPAASLVNSSGGDWGYVTVLIEGKDKNKDKWQAFFNDLRRRHLIPIIRLATIADSRGFWKRPDEGEAQVWADFLDSLVWPVKNRYVIIYNEPNHGTEWGQKVDATNYAKVLDQTITALKKKNEDFFVLNAGLDASTPQQLPNYQEESFFLTEMNQAVPGIFNRLDGWVSHSYPNPAFVGSPNAFGKGTVRTYLWELDFLRNLGVNKNLPIFITETGWKHAEGMNYDLTLPNSETVANYYLDAFTSAWNNSQIVTVTPFLLSYQDYPFDHFSFKGVKNKDPQISQPSLEATQTPEYYPHYYAIQNLPKLVGKPVQDHKAKLTKGEVYSSIVSDQIYVINLTFKNIGQSIWENTKLVALQGGSELGIESVELPKGVTVEPDKDYTFTINLKAPKKGNFKVSLQLIQDDKQFDSKLVEFTTEVKEPVILQILSKLKWKDSTAGEYILRVSGAVGDSEQKVILGDDGKSIPVEARYLLPDYNFEFSLEKPYYYPKTIHQKVKPGVNLLDFGILQPNLFQAIFNPKELWKLSPWSK